MSSLKMRIMPTYRLIVAYDGTAYYGWQKQPKLPSIEGVLEAALRRVFKVPVEILGASRTDAGVHALGQVVRVKTDLAITPERLMFACNNSLPSDILIRRADLVSDTYSPHSGVVKKVYYYHLFMDRPMPYAARYGWYYPRAINIEQFKVALAIFVGTHNFRSFCSVEDTRENMVRTIDSITVMYLQKFKAYRVTVTGERFLRHMIRRIVGAAVTVATENSQYTLEDLKTVLHNKNPHHTLPNAPSQGLVLSRIIYQGAAHV